MEATALHTLILVHRGTFFLVRFLFLGVHAEGSTSNPCSNTSNTEGILIALEGHLGLAHPGDVPAVLLLVPSGFEYTCKILGISEPIKTLGSIIGEITEPRILESSEHLTIAFRDTTGSAGMQKLTEFLLPGGVLMTNQVLITHRFGESSEESWEGASNFLVEALAGEGTFLLRDE